MMQVKSRAESLSRHVLAAVVGIAWMTLLATDSARAQASPPRITYRAWVGGGLGLSPSGLVGAWEMWASMGVLGIGYQSSATDDLNGMTNLARGVLVGAVLPYDRLLGRVAVGSVSARRCIVHGEQAANANCTAGMRTEIAVSADYAISSRGTVHTSYFSVPDRRIGHSGFIVGLTLGRVAR